MGNVPVNISVRTQDYQKSSAFAAMSIAFARATVLEGVFSHYQPNSLTSQINTEAAHTCVPLSKEYERLLLQALHLSRETNGAFDISFPSSNKRANYHDLNWDKHKHCIQFSKPGMKLDVSSLAKGIIVDEISRILSKKGFRHHLVNAGGDLYASGKWEVTLRNPAEQTDKTWKTKSKLNSPVDHVILCTLKKRPDVLKNFSCEAITEIPTFTLKNEALATSGDYERGRHIFNPQTDKPVANNIRSISVIAPNTMTANGWSTAFFVSNPLVFTPTSR